jgi:hypothetical protein
VELDFNESASAIAPASPILVAPKFFYADTEFKF